MQALAQTAALVFAKKYRALGPIVADRVVEEHHEDQDQITQHQVEHGSAINGKKFALPSGLTLTYWSLSGMGAGLKKRSQCVDPK